MEYSKMNYTGEIRLIEKTDKLEYRLLSKTESAFNNLEIDYIFNKPYVAFWYVDLKIHVHNKLVFHKRGVFHKAKKFGNEEWFIKNIDNGSITCIGDVFFDNVGNKALLVLEKL